MHHNKSTIVQNNTAVKHTKAKYGQKVKRKSKQTLINQPTNNTRTLNEYLLEEQVISYALFPIWTDT